MRVCTLFERFMKHEIDMDLMIRSLNPNDWQQVREIYQEGILTENATFETQTPQWEEWDETHIKECRFAALVDDQIVGWAALSRVSSRCIYAGVAEVSIYVKRSEQRKSIGRALLQTIIKASEQEGYWTLQAGIFPENEASLVLFTSQGFREVGFRERISELNSVWRDVILLERRSKVVGSNTGEEMTYQ